MAEESSAPSEQSLSGIFADCVTSFRQFISTLNADGCSVVRLKLVDIAPVLNEFRRSKIWGDQTKAILPPGARGSLDDTLRNSPKIQDTTRGILCRLKCCLDQGKCSCVIYAISGPLTGP